MKFTPAKKLVLWLMAAAAVLVYAVSAHADEHLSYSSNLDTSNGYVTTSGPGYAALVSQLVTMQARVAALTPAPAESIIVTNLGSSLSATCHFAGISVNPATLGELALLWHLLCRYLVKYPMRDSSGLLAQLVSHCAINGTLPEPKLTKEEVMARVDKAWQHAPQAIVNNPLAEHPLPQPYQATQTTGLAITPNQNKV